MTRLLFDTDTPLWRYCLLLSGLAILSSLVIAGFLWTLVIFAHLDMVRFFGTPTSTSIGGIFGTLVIAPVLETYLLAVLITILSSFMSSKFRIAMVSGILWGLLHATLGLLKFFGPAFVFFLLTCAFIAWRKKSFKHAYIAAFVPHVLTNAIGILLLSFDKHA